MTGKTDTTAQQKKQTNLFSFFRKPTTNSNDKPVPPAHSKTGTMTNFSTGKSSGQIKAQVPATVTPSTATKAKSIDSTSTKSQSPYCKTSQETNVDRDDDDLDDSPVVINRRKARVVSAGESSAKKTLSINDEEDEWMESSSDQSVDNDDDNDGDFIADDESGDELEDSADDDDDDDASDDVDSPIGTKRKSKSSKAVKKTTKTSKTPKKARTEKKTPVITPTSTIRNKMNHTLSFVDVAAFSVEKQSSTNNMSDETPMEIDSPRTINPALPLPEGVVGRGSHEHNSFDFLFPEKRRDKNGRRPTDPDYNPRTLFVPNDFLKSQTPAMVQWWYFKADNMDTVLFFKVGKFYELFHMDADIGYSELDLIYMKGTKAHSGFPEVSYGKFASILVSKGYRVARVEQTETPEMLKERNSRQTKKSKVVEREVCSVMTKGTRTFCHLDDLTLLEEATGGSASVLICINEAETTKTEEGEEITEYGVCCIDTVLGVVTVAQFQDDKQRCRLRTLLSKYPPSEVLLPVGHCSPFTTGVLKFLAPKAAVEYLRGDEFPSASDTIKSIETGNYFDKDSFINSLPPILQAIIDGSHDGSSSLVLSAFGGALWQLKRSLIDYEIISLGKILAYVPPDEEISEGDKEKSLKGLLPNSIRQIDGDECGAAMVLDEVALTNLEVLVNNHDRSEKGSLWAFIDRTRTPFGRRLLRQWLVHPLLRPSDIKARSAAVEEILSSLDDISGEVKSLLKNVPDLERLLARVHSNGLKSKGPDHPDSRAVMYETDIYNTRKIRDFADVLTGFEVVLQVAKKFENKKLSSVLLQKTMNSKNLEENPGRFPLEEMAKLLKFYREIFDEKQAKKEGNIRPRPGVDAEYDQAKEDIRQAQLDLEQYLRDMKRKTGINDLKYFGNNKDRYQIEVPMQQTSKVPSSWTSKSQKKTHRRYWTEEIEQWLKQLMDAEDRLASAQRDTLRRVFEKFDSNRAVWSSALSSTANLDALLSLATISSMPGYVWPEILTKSEVAAKGGPQLNIKGGRHPMLEFAMSQRASGDYIPNDLTLGGLKQEKLYIPRMLLLSGPNMGGKSTLLRQTCLIVIMAQLGCKVPADSCVLSPVDRIFTRVGASDKILAGQSTFYVELAETASILSCATEDSLCILDELGRGTATFDGTAIAHAVVDYLVQKIRCRSLFATHYHSLVDDWEIDPRVRLGHMDCLVDSPDSKTSETATEEITFLYKLSDGSSPKSYGINVAKLAGLPDDVIVIALQQSKLFEDKMNTIRDSTDGSDGNSFVSRGQKEKLVSLFERLVLISHSSGSSMTVHELAYIAGELWRRYNSVKDV